MNAYKCIYNEITIEPGPKRGQLIQRTRNFKSFSEAVKFTRSIMIDNIKVVGKPMIEIQEPKQ